MKPLVFKKARRSRTEQTPQALKSHIAKGDRVRVIRGEQRGQEGKVLRVLPRKGRVVVEGINVITKHRRATQNIEGGRVKYEGPIHVSNVMLLDPKSGDPTRVRRRVDKDGTVERIAAKSGQAIPRTR